MGVAEMVQRGGMDAILPVLIHEMLPGDTRLNQPERIEYLKQVMKAASALGGPGDVAGGKRTRPIGGAGA